MKTIFQSFFLIISDEAGQSLSEYALICFFILLAAVAALTLFGTTVSAFFNNFVNAAFGA